ncbi:MAG: helix-turn-helix domain-containing protein [Candidatus Omnitrophota bacterium]
MNADAQKIGNCFKRHCDMNSGNDIDKIDEFFFTAEKGAIYNCVIAHFEKILIEKALEETYGRQVLAAKLLGLNRNTLRKKIKDLHIDTQVFRQ